MPALWQIMMPNDLDKRFRELFPYHGSKTVIVRRLIADLIKRIESSETKELDLTSMCEEDTEKWK